MDKAQGMIKCVRCGQERPAGVNPVAERAWDLLHDPSPKMTWAELKAAVYEYNQSKDIVKSCIAAALESAGGE